MKEQEEERIENELYAPLAEPVRRQIYESVRQASGPVTRDEVAKLIGISRKLAAFHLDKLLQTGWLTASYARDKDRRAGPGAGRPAKRYVASEQSLDLSIPHRNYVLAGRLLAQAVALEDESSPPASQIAKGLAEKVGSEVGDRHRREVRLRRPGTNRALAATFDVLEKEGFEPSLRSGEIALRNCPFHDLAKDAPDVICGMNQGFITGIVQGLGNRDLRVFLDPQPNYCCVRIAKPDIRTTKG